MVSTSTKNLIIAGLCAASLLIVAACSTPQGNPGEGERWYGLYNCSGCHGPNGDDGKAPEIRNPDMSFRSFLATVRDANSPIMPEFPAEKVSKQDVADIYAWLQGN